MYESISRKQFERQNAIIKMASDSGFTIRPYHAHFELQPNTEFTKKLFYNDICAMSSENLNDIGIWLVAWDRIMTVLSFNANINEGDVSDAIDSYKTFKALKR